jgi:hypothetical protein
MDTWAQELDQQRTDAIASHFEPTAPDN